MKAIIEEIRFTEGKLAVRVGFYLSEGEAGYDEYYLDILDAGGKPTGEKKLYPFFSLTSDLLTDTTKKVFKNVIKSRLEEFKTSHTRLDKVADWVGIEVEV